MMKTTNTFAVLLFVRLHKYSQTEGLIYARITVNGTSTELSLKETVSIAQWNADKQQVEGRTPQVKALNAHLDNVMFKLKEKYRQMVDKDLPVDAQAIKDAFTGRQAESKSHTLCELVSYHYRMEGEKLTWGTMKNYKATEEYLKRYIKEKYKKEDLPLKKLDYEFILELESFIRNYPLKPYDRCVGNGVMKHLERLKKIIRWGRQLGWLSHDPFIDYKLSFKRYKRKKLDSSELNRIENQEFTSESLKYVKDLFLFSCYTGLAYADVMALTPQNLERDREGRWWCKIYRQKSDEFAAVPLLSAAVQYINKYAEHPKAVNRGSVFPYISNQEVNRCLKIIAEVCGITKYMSFHLARHTFATTVTLSNGVPIETVSKMLGHKKISTTQIYAEVDEDKLRKDMASIENKYLK